MAPISQELRSFTGDGESRMRYVLMVGMMAISIYAYLHKEPSVNADDMYPVPACFSTLPESVQNDFLKSREYVIVHPDIHEYTKKAMLEGYCQPEDSQVTSLPDNSEQLSINP